MLCREQVLPKFKNRAVLYSISHTQYLHSIRSFIISLWHLPSITLCSNHLLVLVESETRMSKSCHAIKVPGIDYCNMTVMPNFMKYLDKCHVRKGASQSFPNVGHWTGWLDRAEVQRWNDRVLATIYDPEQLGECLLFNNILWKLIINLLLLYNIFYWHLFMLLSLLSYFVILCVAKESIALSLL
jgi:hypothetical protein